MSDTRAAMAMREFRFLDEKRTRGDISSAEEARWNELRGLLGTQDGLEQEPVAAMDPAQQPQGYYGDDGQWYAYPEGYDPHQAQAQQPQGYYGDDGQWYAYPEGYDPHQAQAQQPQGYYGDDGQWYAYPEGYDPNQAHAQQPQGYYGDDGQWYAYPEGYDPNQAYAAPQEQPYATDPAAPQQPYPAESPALQYVQQQMPQTLSPVQLTLESESLDIPALSEPASWAEPTPDPEPTPNLEPPEPGDRQLDAAEPLGDDLFEVTDTDVAPVSEATPPPESLEAQPVLEATPEPESFEPMQSAEDDFSSLNPDLESPAPAPPGAEEPPELARTVEVQVADLEMLGAEEALSSPARPVLPGEPAVPLADEWASAPLAVDTESAPPVSSPPVYDAMPVYDAVPLYGEPPMEDMAQHPSEMDDSDAALLESNRMEVTASYALPAYPPGNVAPFDMNNLQAATPPMALTAANPTHAFDVSELEATPEMESSARARPGLEMPWNTDDGAESPTFDVVDLGAEVETPPPPPAMEAQPEWNTSAETPIEVQAEWTTAPAEPPPSFEAQPEWAAPAEAPIEVQAEWTATPVEEQPVMEAQPEWAAPVEEQPIMEAQPEWAPASATQDWNAAPAAEPQAAWNAPIESQGEWNGTAYEAEPVSTEHDASMFGTTGSWSADESDPVPEPVAEPPPEHSVSEPDVMEVEPEPAMMAPPPPPPAPEPELPIMEAEPEMPEIDLSEDIVEQPPVAVPVSSTDAYTDAYIEGEHRVIIHTVEGQVKRGAIRDVSLLDESIPLEQQAGFAPERISTSRVKAIFFMLATGSRPPQPDGQKVRVTFMDGRQVAGFSHDYKSASEGFFVIPADTRTNTSRIFIYRASVQSVAEG